MSAYDTRAEMSRVAAQFGNTAVDEEGLGTTWLTSGIPREALDALDEALKNRLEHWYGLAVAALDAGREGGDRCNERFNCLSHHGRRQPRRGVAGNVPAEPPALASPWIRV